MNNFVSHENRVIGYRDRLAQLVFVGLLLAVSNEGVCHTDIRAEKFCHSTIVDGHGDCELFRGGDRR